MKKQITRVDDISKYIVCIEGIDGCGKDTQLSMLKDKGFYVTSEPNYETPIGSLLRDILKKNVSLKSKSTIEYLLVADRNEHIADIKDHVNNGDTNKNKLCITGRYKYSGLAYTENPKLTYFLNDGMPEAGLFIFLEINPTIAINRILKRDLGETEIYENINKLTIVNDEFHKIIRHFQQDRDVFPDVVIINAELSPEEIHKQIINSITTYCENL